MNKVREYIKSHWDECIKEKREDEGIFMGLPYPYSVPSVGFFDEMFYWDTYFTNKGLEIDNRQMQAKHNTDNILYLVDKFGYMPNGSNTLFIGRSQPPFLSIMVRDVYDYYGDKVWLLGAYKTLEREYSFWQSKRMSGLGLNIYGGEIQDEEEMFRTFLARVGFEPKSSREDIIKHCVAECESGWDMNPRWEIEAFNYAPIDLNSLMFMLEKNMEYFAKELGNGEESVWQERANTRKQVMLKYMDNGKGLFYDYNFKTKKLSSVFSAASFFPLFAKIADKKQAQAMVDNIDKIEAEYGVLTCEKNNVEGTYQWDYPNGWACLQYIAVKGLDNYGYKEEAKRIAKKYIKLVEKVFEETQNLWEKYNVVEGNIKVTAEYETPKMMGWTAGVYLALSEYIKE